MGYPKALLTVDGVTFADRLISLFGEICEQVVVVLGYEFDRVRAGTQRAAQFAINSNPERGMLSSLQRGLAALNSELEGVFFTPVDVPLVQRDTITTLMSRFDGRASIIPEYRGRGGHPVLMPASLIPEMLKSSVSSSSARQVLSRGEVKYVAVPDPGVLSNINTPQSYAQAVSKAWT